MENSKDCNNCKALCCRSVSVEIDRPTTKADWENIKWLVAHKNINVYKDFDSDWLVEFFTDCDFLTKDNKCSIYNKRMQICKKHSPQDCENHVKGDYYKIIFRKLADVESYLEQKNKNKK